MSEIEKKRITFAALDPYIEQNIILPTEKIVSGKKFVIWGDYNDYPRYLNELYETVTTLRSVIDGCVDYAVGNAVVLNKQIGSFENGVVNRKGDNIEDVARWCLRDYYLTGGFAVQVIRSQSGAIAELYYIDIAHLRTDEHNEAFYYCPYFGLRYGRQKTIVYPKFVQDARHEASIMYFKNNISHIYPIPQYVASVKACEIERCTDDFHLSAINNGFTGSYFINFNNGVPTDEVKEEIERDFNEKFSGSKNAGRIAFSWNDTKENATTIDKVEVEDFGAKYESLAKHCRQQIFTAFRANPNLFGIPTESLGFSEEEYMSAFKLFNRTQIKPVQKKLIATFEKILGKGSITIVPFSLEEAKEVTNPNM